jgi:hypothetical protein
VEAEGVGDDGGGGLDDEVAQRGRGPRVLDLHRLRLLRELKHRGTLGRRVRLTPAAERLVEHTEAILERLEQARADLDASAASIGGTVRVAAFHTTAHAVIPAARNAAARNSTMEPPGTTARHWAAAVCRAAGFEPDVRYQSTDLFLHLRLVRTGHAVALLPGPLPADPAIHLSELPGSPARRIYTTTRRGASQHPANEQHRMTPWRQVSLAGVIRCCVSTRRLEPGLVTRRVRAARGCEAPWSCSCSTPWWSRRD